MFAGKIGRPSTSASGRRTEASMNSAMLAAGCWPSASITSAWVKPRAAAACAPASTAAPLPPLRGRTSTVRSGSARARASIAASLPSVLPSTTTSTGRQCDSTSATTASRRGPVL